jgi:ubiquinone/menaquinone biosynthesis C-methylase UbiE/uncharacterized protein YbaR (Trm112 family)
MKQRILSFICCPECHGSLTLSNALKEGTEIVAGDLNCLGCGSAYPILDGLPIILKDVRRMTRTQRSFGKQWALQVSGRFEGDTLYGKSEEEELRNFKIALELEDLDSLSGQSVLDAGCGSGRLTASLGRAAAMSTIVGFDFSDSARLAYNRCRGLQNVHILQCDLLKPPFQPGSFDCVWSEGVLHHTPSTAQGFSSLSRLVKDNGKIYVWIYPSYVFSPYVLARRILYKPYLIPSPALYILSWLLAAPLYCCHKVREAAGMTQFKHELKSIAFALYDALSPEFRHLHSGTEVREWFASHGYEDIRFVGDIGAVGRKRASA